MPQVSAARTVRPVTGPTPDGDRLSSGGFGRLREYAVSLDRPAPTRYLLAAVYPPHGRRERWRLALARRLPWRLAQRWVLRQGPASGSGSRADAFPLLDALADHPRLLAAAVPGSDALSWIVRRRAGGGAADSELVLLFAAGSPLPAAVVELHRAGASTVCRAEAEALRWLADHLSPTLAAAVPRVLLHTVRNDLEALGLSALAGPSAYVELRRRPGSGVLLGRHLDAAADFLTAFQAETRSPEPWRLPPWAEAAPPPLDDGPEPAWYLGLRSRLRERPLPRVARHGDFWPRNLLPAIGGGPPRVVDWKDLHPAASPLDDLFDFALTRGELLAGATPDDGPEGFLRAFAGAGPASRRVWRFVRRVLAALDVDPALDRDLLALHLLARARQAGTEAPGRLARDRPQAYWLACLRRWRP